MVNNQTSCVIVKAITDYFIDYIASGNGGYNYWRSCNQLQLITITDYDYPNPGVCVNLYMQICINWICLPRGGVWLSILQVVI